MIDLRFIVLAVATVVSLFFGLFILYRNYKSLLNISYAVFIIAISFWALTNLVFQVTNSLDTALLWADISNFSALVIFTSLLYFVNYFPNTDKPFFSKSVVGVFFIITMIFSVLLFSINGFVNEAVVYSQDGSKTIITSFLGMLSMYLYYLVLVILSGYILFKNRAKTKGYERVQIKYAVIGLIFATLFGVFFNLILPLLGLYNLVWLGPYSAYIMVGFFGYAILAHHLFDIRVVIRRTVVYSILLAFVLGVYSLVILVFAQIFGTGGAITVQTIVPSLIATILIVAGFDPLRRVLTKWTDSFLFKGEYKPQDVLNKLSDVLSSVLDLDEALTSIINTLLVEMRLTRAGAFVLTHDPESKKMIVKRAKSVGYGEKKITLNPDGYLITFFEQYIKSHKKVVCKNIQDKDETIVKKCNTKIDSNPIVTEYLIRDTEINGNTDQIVKNTIEELKNLDADISIPIIVKGNLIGVFILGSKKSGDIFSDSDLELLTSVANQTAAAIEKARFYEEDQLKSEFVSIASHELLTPTSAIEGYLSMILDEGMGKVDPQARKYLENVYASSKRLAGLVKDLLNVSRIEGGRIIIQSKNFDIREMIKQVVIEMKPKADQKKINLVIEGIDRDIPQVWADPERVHQVLINIIGNAIKYTDSGSVRVRADFSLSVVRVSVIDTGVGIPKEEIQHLFKKFYRATNADNSGAQGTGLGLYITKQMVELMGGIIKVDSEINKGSVFSFSLPKEKNNKG